MTEQSRCYLDLLDHLVDIAAIVAIASIVVLNGTVSQETLVAVSTIAIGKRVIQK